MYYIRNLFCSVTNISHFNNLCEGTLNVAFRYTHKKVSPVNKAALSFQAGLVHEHYTLFKVLSAVEHKKMFL